MSNRVPCRECGAEILQATADATGGLCMPCKKGTRQQIEAGKRSYERRRDFDSFDAYWFQLVDRVHNRHEVLSGKEDLFYRWSCIYGETMVDGIEAYFECRFDQWELDMESLRVAGFPDIASDFEEARQVIFGDAPLNETTVDAVIMKLLDESDDVQPVLAEIDKLYRRLIRASGIPGGIQIRLRTAGRVLFRTSRALGVGSGGSRTALVLGAVPLVRPTRAAGALGPRAALPVWAALESRSLRTFGRWPSRRPSGGRVRVHDQRLTQQVLDGSQMLVLVIAAERDGERPSPPRGPCGRCGGRRSPARAADRS